MGATAQARPAANRATSKQQPLSLTMPPARRVLALEAHVGLPNDCKVTGIALRWALLSVPMVPKAERDGLCYKKKVCVPEK